MRDCVVSFCSVAEIRDFVALATRQPCPVRVEHGGHGASATAIMSIFSMGLNTPLRVVAPDVPEMAEFFRTVESRKWFREVS